jgi:hypothetical protein
MRKLAAQDSMNPIWNDDLRTFEKARFRQVQTEATEAAQSRNVAGISQLLAEIEQQTWVEPPPKGLVQALRKADAQFRGQQMRSLLNDLDGRLNDAFAARDPIRGRLDRQEWIALTASAPLAPSDPIWERVQPALSWLEEEDRQDEIHRAHEDSPAALVQALDDPTHVSPAELERLAHAVLQYGQGMPEAIQRRYVSRLRVAEATQSRRLRLIIAASAAGLLLTGSLTFYTIRSWARANDATQAAGAINDMIERGEIEQTGGFLEKLRKADAGLLSYPSMIEVTQKFEAIQEKETDRAVQFDKAIRAAEQAPLDHVNPPELEAARKLARQETEKQAILAVVQRRAAALSAERAKFEQDVGPRLDIIGRKIAQAQARAEHMKPGVNDDTEIVGPLDEAQRELANLGSNLRFVGIELQSLATVLGQKIETVHTRLDVRRRKARRDDELTSDVTYSSTALGSGRLVKFAGHLDAYARAFPDDPRTAAFRQTRDEQALWYDVEAWNDLTVAWKGRRTALTPQEGKQRADLCARFVTQHPSLPGIDDVVRYQQYAESIARRSALDDGPVANLRRLLADIFVSHIWMVTISDDNDITGRPAVKRYYAAKQPERNRDYYEFSSIISFEGRELPRTLHKERITFLGLSPQSMVADRFKPVLADDSKLTQWETVMIDLVGAIRNQPDMEPILQVALLRKVVEAGAKGSEPLREALEAVRAHLDDANVDVNVPWMNPEAPRQPNRSQAAQVVESLPDLASVRADALARRERLERAIARIYRTVGWLSQNADGWQLHSGVATPQEGDLWVVVPKEDKHGQWKKAGTITKGKATVEASESASLAEGRPVFVMIHES